MAAKNSDRYNDGHVRVTDSLVQVGENTYAIRNVTSVKMIHEPHDIETSLVPLLGVAFILFLSIFIAPFVFTIFVGIAASGVMADGIISIAIFVYYSMKNSLAFYRVALTTSAGEVMVVRSTNIEKMQLIRDVISMAISQYR